MAGKIKDIVPAGKGSEALPARREEEYPLFSLQRDMNRLFDDFFRGFDLKPLRMADERWAGFNPRMDLEETEKEYRITAELPGMEEKDVEVFLTGNSITLKGEKKEEKEEKGKNYYHTERSYGSFHRTVPLPDGIDLKKVDAEFKNGVLMVKLPKTVEAKTKSKKVPVKSGKK
ncbi:MAG TPA: Hsp20/alpha crystallin family protein [Syntrophales bacterium]|nr:Hsp20/alpha crystallin family protein [Syntrophales bacterium]